MILVYFLIGIFASILSALPLGASNIAVINTTLKQNANQAFKIAITAGIAEVILSYYALHCNVVVKDFFNNNVWVQVFITVLLLAIGVFLFFKKDTKKFPKQRKLTQSKYIMGFILGLVNPPVLIYWVLVYGFINNNHIMLSLKSSFGVLFLFFTGIYLGKLLTLYFYSRFSLIIKKKTKSINLVVNKFTGALLVIIGIVQMINIYSF